MDRDWGHVIIRFCPHPPFNARIILNGHDHVAVEATRQNVDFVKESNCFTHITDAAGLAGIAYARSALQRMQWVWFMSESGR